MTQSQSFEPITSSLALDVREHGICWVLPLGAEVAGGVIDLPGGALVQGKFMGRITCRSGSLIIASTGSFGGQAEADRIYVDGEIAAGPNVELSSLRGNQLIAISERAKGGADLVSLAFAIHTRTFSARFTTLERS